MGIPKFFRYISERYPMATQRAEENNIPEFDNLYLDFNGVIHNCSHPNDEGGEGEAFRGREEEDIFAAVFAYLGLLFGKIKPKKLFFIAVDGVAPRAKMNQQRGRRFRSAKDAMAAHEEAVRNGENIRDKVFDSNCITPGTPFMARLSKQLRFFINKKITEDAHWRDIEVIFSGHEVPGEGEHKIMEYIRHSKAQPGYNPNVRHCLYGLDADLIMLGLLSHEPHFCLFREEVKFGPSKPQRKKSSIASTNFVLLHLSLIREYLDLEFHDIAATLPFKYNLERIIDDFILLATFVGNDFLPHLPDLSIRSNGLERLFDVYKTALPRLGGYILDNEQMECIGSIDLRKLQEVLNGMNTWENEVFEKEYADVRYLKRKQGTGTTMMEDTFCQRGEIVLTQPRRIIFENVRDFVLSIWRHSPRPGCKSELSVPNTFSVRDRLFIAELAAELQLEVSWDEYDDDDENLVTFRVPSLTRVDGCSAGSEDNKDRNDYKEGNCLTDGAYEQSGSGIEMDIVLDDDRHDNEASDYEDEIEDEGTDIEESESEDVWASCNEHEPEGDQRGSGSEDVRASCNDQSSGEEILDERVSNEEGPSPEALSDLHRVLRKYEQAQIVENEDSENDCGVDYEQLVQSHMDDWKRKYYREKLNISYNDPVQMQELVYKYVQGLQWIMFYYFRGIASWGWFYNYHCAPRISDLKGVDKMQFKFDLGEPFKPFEQLMGVLPSASKEQVPEAFRYLMIGIDSPIKDFYPLEFSQDLDGGKNPWEAVVRIPFIDEERLLRAMKARENLLTTEEKLRNTFGTSQLFKFSPNATAFYPSSLPGIFLDLHHCTCTMEPYVLPTLDGLQLVPGLCKGVLLGIDALAGFPTLQTLPHSASLAYHGVNVHGSESKNKSMVVHVKNLHDCATTEKIARMFMGKRVFVGWPFVREAMVVAVSDRMVRYESPRLLLKDFAAAEGKNEEAEIVGSLHSPQIMNYWREKVENIKQEYSRRSGVITGDVEFILHVRPLKGLKLLESGALVKDYEGQNNQSGYALQMTLPEVVSEDPRFMERDAPKLTKEFPPGTKVIYLRQPSYGVLAEVVSTTEQSISIILEIPLGEQFEIEKFKAIANARIGTVYQPSFKVAQQLGISGHALSLVTSSFLVQTSGERKVNLGLSFKFDAKSLKVIGYSRKTDRYWEFSAKAVKLIQEYKIAFPAVFASLAKIGNNIAKASDIFPGEDSDDKVRQIKSWLDAKGIRELEAVSFECDSLGKETVFRIALIEDTLVQQKRNSSSPTGLDRNRNKRQVTGVPRLAVLKPSYAMYRLQGQTFSLGDRVIIVMESGNMPPLGSKGVVVGVTNASVDVVWDEAFIFGSTLNDLCPMYRGSSVENSACLNLSRPQFLFGNNAPHATQQPTPVPTHRGRGYSPYIAPRPAIQSQDIGFNAPPVHAPFPWNSATAPPSAPPIRGDYMPRTTSTRGATFRGRSSIHSHAPVSYSRAATGPVSAGTAAYRPSTANTGSQPQLHGQAQAQVTGPFSPQTSSSWRGSESRATTEAATNEPDSGWEVVSHRHRGGHRGGTSINTTGRGRGEPLRARQNPNRGRFHTLGESGW